MKFLIDLVILSSNGKRFKFGLNSLHLTSKSLATNIPLVAEETAHLFFISVHALRTRKFRVSNDQPKFQLHISDIGVHLIRPAQHIDYRSTLLAYRFSLGTQRL